MGHRNAIRYQGRIESWKDERGFGFIQPNGGGPLVFVHATAFVSNARRPAANGIVTFELTANDKGQPRADNVEFVRARASQASSHQTGVSTVLAAVAFLVTILILVVFGKLPAVVLGIYTGVSVLTFIAYAADKTAARHNRWRVRESTLHILGLAGGWPGALVARQMYRHKTIKQAFRTALWLTVAMNCAGFGWLLSSASAKLFLKNFGSS